MEDILAKIPDWIEVVALALMSLTILATVIVRVTPSTADDEAVSGIAKWIIKVVQFLPTIGINPKTKKLEEAYEELKQKETPKA